MVIQTNAKHITLYNSLDDLSIFRFDKISRGNFKWLIKEYDTESNITDTDLPKNTFKIWEKLYLEYSELVKNPKTILIYVLTCEINYLETLQIVVGTLISQVAKGKPANIQKEYFDELHNWGFAINEDAAIESELIRLSNQLRGSNSKLDRKISEYKEAIKDDGSKKTTLIQQKVRLSMSLKMNIDIHTTSVTEWIAFWNELNEMNKSLTKK